MYQELDFEAAFGQRPFVQGCIELEEPFGQACNLFDSLNQEQQKQFAFFLQRDYHFTYVQLCQLHAGYRDFV